jgi:hypothetical protein
MNPRQQAPRTPLWSARHLCLRSTGIPAGALRRRELTLHRKPFTFEFRQRNLNPFERQRERLREFIDSDRTKSLKSPAQDLDKRPRLNSMTHLHKAQAVQFAA